VVLFCLCLTVYSLSEVELANEFMSWRMKYGKIYANEQEEAARFRNFKASIDRISQLNERTKTRGVGAQYGVNKFSDMTTTEFEKNVLMKPFMPTPPAVKALNQFQSRKVELPQTWDWRTKNVVTPVKDQAQCGSCWAFSVTENIESVWIIANNVSLSTFEPLAPQQIVDCDDSDAGCSGGEPNTAYEYVIGAGGLDTEKSYPYTAEDGTCAFKPSDVESKISSWSWSTNTGDEATLQNNLVAVSPLSICVDARYWQDYQSGVMTAYECDWIVELDHCVQLVGYDQTASTPYWIARNSWGTDWGEKGFILLQMGSNTCGLTEEASSAKV